MEETFFSGLVKKIHDPAFIAKQLEENERSKHMFDLSRQVRELKEQNKLLIKQNKILNKFPEKSAIYESYSKHVESVMGKKINDFEDLSMKECEIWAKLDKEYYQK